MIQRLRVTLVTWPGGAQGGQSHEELPASHQDFVERGTSFGDMLITRPWCLSFMYPAQGMSEGRYSVSPKESKVCCHLCERCVASIPMSQMIGIDIQVKARGLPSEDDPTIAGHLLRLRDQSGQPLSDDALHAEFSVMFIAGV